MTKEQEKKLNDFKAYHVGNHTTNHREIEVGAMKRAISGIKKMSIKSIDLSNVPYFVY